MTVHLVGLPHTPFDEQAASTCAYTAKSVRLSKMLSSVDEDVVVYWGGSKKRAQEGPWTYVSCMTDAKQTKHFGKFNQAQLPVAEFDTSKEYWQEFNTKCLAELEKRVKPGDFIGLVAGATQSIIAGHFQGRAIIIEPEVGYSGIITSGTFACFESYAWMHWVYGMAGIDDGRYFDTVIPNYQDPADFEHGTDGGYLLYLGRMIQRKGVREAADIAKKAGVPLVLAGAGISHQEGNIFYCTDGTQIEGDHVSYVGAIGPEERKILISHARALIVPTRYIEPFGTVHIEALLSGIPVIAPDYGVFTETIVNKVNGWRFRMEREAVSAVKQAEWKRNNDWQQIREDAIARFSNDACARSYKVWLDRLRTLFDGEGWYSD